jgi:hypothetical protein
MKWSDLIRLIFLSKLEVIHLLISLSYVINFIRGNNRKIVLLNGGFNIIKYI